MSYPRWQPIPLPHHPRIPPYIIGAEVRWREQLNSPRRNKIVLQCAKSAHADLQVEYDRIQFSLYDNVLLTFTGESYEYEYPVLQSIIIDAVTKFLPEVRLAFFQPFSGAHIYIVPRRPGCAPSGLEITTQDLTED